MSDVLIRVEGRAGRITQNRPAALNARIAGYGKAVVSLLQGLTLGGGMGWHAAHRAVGAKSRIALPEVAIGLVPDVGGIVAALRARRDGFADAALKAMARMSPLAMVAAPERFGRLRADPQAGVIQALALECRFAYRAIVGAHFLERLRVAVLDKDRAPRWRHPPPGPVPARSVAVMLAPPGQAAHELEGETT